MVQRLRWAFKCDLPISCVSPTASTLPWWMYYIQGKAIATIPSGKLDDDDAGNGDARRDAILDAEEEDEEEEEDDGDPVEKRIQH